MESVTNIEAICSAVVDEAFHVHAEIGPGLLESVYQKVLVASLRKRGFEVESEVPVSFECGESASNRSCASTCS